MESPGKKFREAIADNNPLMVVGAVNAYCAKMAEKAGHKALYLSGAGVANASFGLPDLAITTLNDVAEDSRRITQATDLPLLIDIDKTFVWSMATSFLSNLVFNMNCRNIGSNHFFYSATNTECTTKACVDIN